MSSFNVKSLVALFPQSSTYTTSHSSLAIAGAIVLGFGKEDLVRNLCEELVTVLKDDQQAQVLAFRKLREALLKASPLVGFPRVCWFGMAVL